MKLGPGFVPFSLATHFIGCNESIKNYVDIDIDYQSFPYNDNKFDFIYCRHVLEDIPNPDFALREIFRVKCNTMIEDYIALVSRAINESIQNTNYFVNHYKHLLVK